MRPAAGGAALLRTTSSPENFPSERNSRVCAERKRGARRPIVLPVLIRRARARPLFGKVVSLEDESVAGTRKRSWAVTLLSYAGQCRGKMAASLACSVLSVAAGLAPFYAVYRIMEEFMHASPALQAGAAGAANAGLAVDGAAVGLWLIVAATGYVASKALFGASTVLSHVSAYTILEALRRSVVEKLMKTSLGTASSQSIGQMKNVFVDRIEGVEVPLAHMIPELSGNALLAVAIVAWMAVIDVRLALACLVTVPVGLIVFAGGLGTYNKKYAAYMAEGNRVNSVMVEYIEGIQVVKAFNQATDSYQKYADAVCSFKDFTLGWFKATWVSMNLAFAILPTTLLGVLPVGLTLYLAGAVTPAQLGIGLVLALAVVAPLMKLSGFLNEAKSMEYAVADARAFLDLPELPEPAVRACVHGTDVELSGVSFSYEGGDEVLHGIDLAVPQGSFCALVGPSGGGKSTVARLIARHWDVDAGSVRVGGSDVRTMPLDQLSELVSFVAQDNYLFNCPLKENVRLGRPGATDAEVLAAARAACCDEFIDRLPAGWDTLAGEAGRALSGGERQRISIARAILKDAPIVILDEATAFTDPENEARIQRSIAELSRGKTLLVIAHRLSTVVAADRIAVVERGRIVAQGTHEGLRASCPLYERMWQAHVGAKAVPSFCRSSVPSACQPTQQLGAAASPGSMSEGGASHA